MINHAGGNPEMGTPEFVARSKRAQKEREENAKRDIKPQPGRQTAFVQSTAKECAFLGEAGGAKSYAMLLDFLYDIQHREHNGLLFRRQLKDLNDLIEKTKLIFPLVGGIWQPGNKMWKFPSGARLHMAHMEHEKDVLRYQGWELTWVGWDELSHFGLMPYLFMFSRLRCANPHILKRVRATSNPYGPGTAWVWRRFCKTLDEGETAYFARDENDAEVRLLKHPDHGKKHPSELYPNSTSRQWFRSVRAENKIMMDANTDYEASLDMLPEEMRQAFKFGNYVTQDTPNQLIRSEWIRKAMDGLNPRIKGGYAHGTDFAHMGADKTVFVLGNGNTVLNVKWEKQTSHKQAADMIWKDVERLVPNVAIGIDANGTGAGCLDRLITDHPETRNIVNGMTLKDRAFDREMETKYKGRIKFDNARSQMYWQLRCDFEAGNIDLSYLTDIRPDDGTHKEDMEGRFFPEWESLERELAAFTYDDGTGHVKIVKKSVLKKSENLGHSPDFADALAIWNWVRNRRREEGPSGSHYRGSDYAIEGKTPWYEEEIEMDFDRPESSQGGYSGYII